VHLTAFSLKKKGRKKREGRKERERERERERGEEKEKKGGDRIHRARAVMIFRDRAALAGSLDNTFIM